MGHCTKCKGRNQSGHNQVGPGLDTRSAGQANCGGMKADKKRNQPKAKFRPGRAGCEALMFVIRGYAPGSPAADENLKPSPMDVLRVCAEGIHEILPYMKRWEPGFDIRSIRSCGLVVMLSGSPYQE